MSDRKYRRRATRNTDYQTFQDFSGIQNLENYQTIPSDDSSHESALPPLDHMEMESVYSQSPYQLRSSQRFYDQQSTSQRIYNQQPYRSSTSFQHSDAYNANNPSFIFNQPYDSSEIPESENSFQTISNQLYHQSEQGHRRNKKPFS